jgi:hypothetical protein
MFRKGPSARSAGGPFLLLIPWLSSVPAQFKLNGRLGRVFFTSSHNLLQRFTRQFKKVPNLMEILARWRKIQVFGGAIVSTLFWRSSMTNVAKELSRFES